MLQRLYKNNQIKKIYNFRVPTRDSPTKEVRRGNPLWLPFGNPKLKKLLMGVSILFYFNITLNASISLSDYPKIKDSWDEGELSIAINRLKEVVKDKSLDDDTYELIKKLSFQKNRLDKWLKKAEILLKQKKFKEASKMIKLVKAINSNYTPYINLKNKIKSTQLELKYPSEIIFDGKSLGDKWKPYSSKGGDFTKYAKFDNDKFIADVPEGNKWGNTGVISANNFINFKETNQSKSYHLKFDFDNKNTTGFVIDIESLIYLVCKKNDNGEIIIELHKGGFYLYGRITYGKFKLNSIPKTLEIVMRPDNRFYLKLADGRSIETVLKNNMSKNNYSVKIYTQAEKKDLTCKMALKSITMQEIPFKKQDYSKIPTSQKPVVLFDGSLDGNWLIYNSGGAFYKHAHFYKNQLIIDVPKDNKWGITGIGSVEPMIWLDKLGKDGIVKTTFFFNSNLTTDFALTMASRINSTWKEALGSEIVLSWRKTDENNTYKLEVKIDKKIVLDELLKSKSPSNISFSLRKGEVTIESDIFDKKIFPWSYLTDNRSLHLWAVSLAYKHNLSAKMALKEIILERKFGNPIPESKPAKGVDELQIKEIYGGKTRGKWKCYENLSKDKNSSCDIESSNLSINIKEDAKSTFGMISKKAIIYLDKRRIDEASLKVVMHFNPKKTDHFYIIMGQKYHYIVLEKKDKDTYLFKWGDIWSRSVDAKWIENKWNGKLNILLSKDSLKIGLDGGISINIPDPISKKFYITILATPLDPYKSLKNGANLELQKITTQWIAPDGMSAVDRWEFVEDEDFDADKFLDELGEKI